MILRQFAAAALAGFVVIMSCYSAVGMHNDALVATGAAAGTRGHRGPSISTAVVVAASAVLLATSPAVNPGVAPFEGAKQIIKSKVQQRRQPGQWRFPECCRRGGLVAGTQQKASKAEKREKGKKGKGKKEGEKKGGKGGGRREKGTAICS